MKKMLLGVLFVLLGIYLALMGYCYYWPFMDKCHILLIVAGIVIVALGYVDENG